MRSRLSAMMFLCYAAQGAFWPLLAVHLKDLGIDGPARGWIFATLPIASLAVPLCAGQFVDRVMAGERLLRLIYAAAACVLAVMASGLVTGASGFFGLSLLLWTAAAPSYALANAIAFRHLPRPQQQFPGVRLWGTIGWMTAGWLVTGVMAFSGSNQSGRGAFEAFWVAAGLAGGLALFCAFLPSTPPVPAEGGTARRTWALDDVLALAARPGMTTFLLVALGVHLTTPFVYQVLPTYLEAKGMPRTWITSAFTLGQWPEIAVLAALPWMFARLGAKTTLGLGIGAWVVRYGSLAFDPPLWVAVAGIPLHGVGVGCFAIAGGVFVDRHAEADRRASAQAVYTVVTAGLGSLLGSLLAGQVVGRHSGHYALIFFIPCVIDAALLVYFCVGFRPSALTEIRPGASPDTGPRRHDAVRGSVTRVGNLVTESADG